MDPFATLDWPGRAAAAVVQPDGSVDRWGDTTEPFALASVTKLLTAMTVLIAHEEGTLDLDEPIGPGGSTTTDLLAHTAGVAPDTLDQLAPPAPAASTRPRPTTSLRTPWPNAPGSPFRTISTRR